MPDQLKRLSSEIEQSVNSVTKVHSMLASLVLVNSDLLNAYHHLTLQSPSVYSTRSAEYLCQIPNFTQVSVSPETMRFGMLKIGQVLGKCLNEYIKP